MCSKKGILYGAYHDWTEEISVVYEMDKEGYFPENKFEGEIENGEPNGNGIWTQCCGSTYVGHFVNGLREGFGTFTWSVHSPNGVGMYEGDYKKNRQSGKPWGQKISKTITEFLYFARYSKAYQGSHD